jgi:hypothetical protein
MIERAPRRARYTTIDNQLVEDDRLSYRAIGLLVYILSKPDHWTTNRDQLAAVHQEGVTAVRSTLAELEQVGYLERRRERTPDGMFVWRSIIHEVPVGTSGGESTGGEVIGGESAALVSTEVVSPEVATEITASRSSSAEQTTLIDVPAAQALLDQSIKAAKQAERDVALTRFERFWDAYPKRNGKRVGKAKTKILWMRMSPDEHMAAWKGVRNYARSDWIPKDPERWLRDRCWEDWQEPAQPSTNGRRQAPTVVEPDRPAAFPFNASSA